MTDLYPKLVEWNIPVVLRSLWEEGTTSLGEILKICTSDTIKLLEEIIGKTFSDLNRTNVFLGQSPKAIEIKTKINKWDLSKLTSFCTAKETINKTKIQPTGMGGNICKSCV